jgi:ribosomal-protein-alanine N-acetyltransferase
MVETDIDAILAIERQSFEHPWQRASFLGELVCDYAYGYTVRCEPENHPAQIVAYICFRLIIDEMHLLKIAVAPRWRRRGVASKLLDTCFAMAHKKGAQSAVLEVRPSNKSAISLYHKLGFHLVEKRKNYYTETREDALILKKKLKEAS